MSMATPFLADLEDVSYPASEPTADSRYRIDTGRVLPGMFVAELDRPWSDTPLPQTGLLVTGDAELAAIRRHCHRVVVDAARSNVELLAAIRAAAVLSDHRSSSLELDTWSDQERTAAATITQDDEQARLSARRALQRRAEQVRREAATGGARQQPRNDVHPSDMARGQVRALLRDRARAARPAGGVPPTDAGTPVRRRGWFGLNGRSGGQQPAAATVGQAHHLPLLRASWGAAIGAQDVPEGPPLRDTLAQARPVHAQLVAVAERSIRQVRLGKPLATEPAIEVAEAFAGALLRAPDAMRWLGAVHAQGAPVPNAAVGVASQLAEFGRSLGMTRDSLRELTLLGLFADIGKALLPREIVEQPGVLAAHDYALMKQHVSIGLDLLSRSAALPDPVLHGIAQHHERLDGSGYPDAAKGESIGLYGRMAGIVDSFCALTTARPYANPLSVEDALAALYDWCGPLFDRELFGHFLLATGAYPIGTMVELSGGEIAAVVDRHPGGGLQPKLVVLTAPDKGPLRPVRDRAGEQDPDDVYAGARVRIARGLPAGAFGLRLRDFYAREAPGL